MVLKKRNHENYLFLTISFLIERITNRNEIFSV